MRWMLLWFICLIPLQGAPLAPTLPQSRSIRDGLGELSTNSSALMEKSPESLQGRGLHIDVAAEEAIIMNAKTGKILFEKNGFKPAYPASTTKIATALLALQKCRNQLDLVLTVEKEALASITPQAKKQSNYRCPPYWLETDVSHVGLKKGEELKLYDLLHALLVASAGDASNVIAQGLGKTIPKFMDELNAYLKTIGCKNTFFNNPSGLHHPEHITTAYDLAIMAREGLKDPLFRKIVALTKYTCPTTNLEYERTFIQTNHLLKHGAHYYEKAIGIKTGTTQSAGKNLVAAAQDGDRILIAVALGYKGPRSELYQDVIKMFETAFKEPKMRRTLLSKGEQKLIVRPVGARRPVKTYLADDVTYEFYPSEEVPIKASVVWTVPSLPIAKGSIVAKIKLTDDQGILLLECPLLSLEEVKPTLWHSFTHFFSKKNLFEKKRELQIVCVVGVVLALLFWVKKCTKQQPRRAR